MPHEISRARALVNASVVLALTALGVFGGAHIAGRHWQWQKTFRVRAEFAQIGGLELGGRVRVQGMDAGVVEAIEAPTAPGRPVTLILRLDERLRPLVRADAVARIALQGVVGARVVEIVPGKDDAPMLLDGGRLKSESPIEVADLLRDAQTGLARVDAVARAAERGLAEVNAIAATIRQGKGSLGRFVQDDEAYNRLVAMSARGEKSLRELDENLAALKHTWPLSRYFEGRAFYDLDRVLYQPGSERESRVYREEELFEPGRAVLTAGGRQRLDETAAWFKQLRRPKSTEIVVAAFTDDSQDEGEDMARILTQDQADAVRKYLMGEHKLEAIGWFGARKMAAVGFGTHAPRASTEAPRNPPSRRVEIILFTPQS